MNKISNSHDKVSDYVSFRFSRNFENKKVAQSTRMKEKINGVLLDYFVQEGFRESTLKLSEETGFSLHTKNANEGSNESLFGKNAKDISRSSMDFYNYGKGYIKGFSSIDNRKQVKYLILKGDISEAIRVIGTYYPTILDANNLLLFKLLRLNLIEMIRNHNSVSLNPSAGGLSSENETESEEQFLSRILAFVRDNLLNKITHSMDLLRQLEITMSLLCFDFDHRKPVAELSELPETLRDLLKLSLRSECYRAVNRAILDWESTSVSDIMYLGNGYDDKSLPSGPLDDLVSENPGDSDASDIEIDVGPDVVKSIENMISSVPQTSISLPPKETGLSDSDHADVFVSANSKLEEIARLWLATESILVLEKFIPQKRYLQDPSDGATQL